jgi:RNA polymerase sigma-70 factor, ECF subfamily
LEERRKFSIRTDEELMFFVSKGEVTAFDELYSRYSRNLLLYFSRMLNYDRALAEDALQDLFMKLAEAPEKFDTDRSFKTWIFTVASNTCKNYYRHNQVVSESRKEMIFLNQQLDESGFVSIASKMDAKQFRIALEETLLELPEEKREAFILKYQEDKSISEIALIQNCPEGSVKSRLHYTIKILEEKLKIFDPKN